MTEASSGIPIHLKGVVTALSGWKDSFFLQDASGGISVDRQDNTPVHQGDAIELDGVTGAGLFAPVAVSKKLSVTGRKNLPSAREYARNSLVSGLLDSQRVVIRGIVRSAAVKESWGRKVLFLGIYDDGGIIETRVHDFPAGEDFSWMVDAEVEVEGVCGTKFNEKRQFEQVRMFVPTLRDVRISKQGPRASFDLPLTSIENLARFGASQSGHRVRIEGTVTWAGDSHLFYLQNGSYGVRVKILQAARLTPGTQVDAVGFSELSDQVLSLEQAAARPHPSRVVTAPVSMQAINAIQTTDGFTFAPYAARLVRVEGNVIEAFQREGVQTLLLKDGEVVFRAEIDSRKSVAVAPNGRILVTGVCEMENDGDGAPRAFRILLRTTNDLTVLSRLWWTPAHLLWLIAALFVAGVGIAARNFGLQGSLFATDGTAYGVLSGGLRSKLANASRMIGIICGSVGFIVLTVGWLGGVQIARALIPGCVEMKANAAIGLLLLGVALSLNQASQKSLIWRWIKNGCCTLVIVLGALTLIEYLTGLKFNLDELFFKDLVLAGIPGSAPGRMATATACNFILVGTILLFLDAKRFVLFRQLATLLVASSCLFYLVGYLYSAETLYALASRAAVAVHTASVLFLLSLGTLIARPEEGLMATVVSPAPGGVLARRLLPTAFLIPAILGWLRWQGQLAGLYDTAFGLSMMTATNMVAVTFLIWVMSGLLNRMDVGRSRSEERLRESETQLRQMADAMPQIVWTSGPDGNPDYYNRRWNDYTGLAFGETHTDWQSAIHPDDLSGTEEGWAGAILGGEASEIEFRLRRAADGAYRWHLARAIPVRDAIGRIVRWFGTTTDVEDYKRHAETIQSLNESLEARVRERTVELTFAVEELSRTGAQLHGLLDATTQVAIVAVDCNRVIRVFNKGAERMLLYRAAEVIGLYTTDLFMDPEETAGRLEQLGIELGRPATRDDLLMRPAREERMRELEMSYMRKDGVRLTVILSVTVLAGEDGNVHGYLGVATDITVRKALETELRLNNERLLQETVRAENANQAKAVFLATMSHEIRTPMNAILGMADMLWESRLDAEQRQQVDVFRRAGSSLLTLVNDLLDLSKIDSGHLELEQVEFSPEDVVEEAIELIAAKAQAKRLLVTSRMAPGLPPCVLGDSARVRQVLLNLIGNAVKFTSQGEVLVNVSSSGDTNPGLIEFEVSDTGIGVPAGKLETIFEDFMQGDVSTTRQYGGTGLGLGISRRLAECMGGSLTALNRPAGGSVFKFVAAFEIPRGSAGGKRREVADFHGKRVLILDDNATNRLILRETVASWGLESDDFGQPSDALENLTLRQSAGKGYSLVLTDNRMEAMDGFEFAKAVRQLDANLPVVMLTSDAQPGDAERRVAAGLAGYALKPVKRSHLFQIVSDALGLIAKSAEPGSNSFPFGPALRVLVAEDSNDNRLLIEAYMKGGPHTLTFAEDGKLAVEEFAGRVFDLVLMDINMPGMDGLSATRAIREIERLRASAAVPIIALSANAGSVDIAKSMEAGCDGHISKPVSKRKLLAAIQEHTSKPPQFGEGMEAEEIELLRHLIPQYLRDRKEDLAAIPRLIEQRDFDRLRTLGHNMKGSGASYGYPEISRLGTALQSAAEERAPESLQRNADELAQFMQTVSAS